MSKIIPYGRQNISEADIQAVIEVLRSDFLTQGNVVPAFEAAVAKYCGAQYGVAVNSATSALHIACLALGVGKGDFVWTTPISFVASANCAIYCGASVDFVDIDERTCNMSVKALAEKLKKAEKSKKLPKVVIPVHLCGQSCDMEGIYALKQQYGFSIIEDASHAIGGRYKDEPIGNCKYSDITIFSFHPVKIITTGEGGMAVTNNEKIYSHLQRLRSHGITRNPLQMTHPPDGSWYYQQIELGYNYRMTDIQAALGLSQLSRIDEFVKERHVIKDLYDILLNELGLELPWQHPDTYSALHLYVLRVKKSNRISHLEIFERLKTNGILVNIHYIPIYHHPFFEKMGFDRSKFPNSEIYYKEAISLPIYPGLSEEHIKLIVKVINAPVNHQTIF
jgi:UDP-4-amino-4,6-dideoxy-N-acetyl-beta-L-altrosamine transaminase